MAEPARSYEQLHERAARLHAIGLTEALIRTVVAKATVARLECTLFDVPIFPAFSQWAHGHRALRELLDPSGWTFDDADISISIRPDEKLAVTIATGNERTGREGEPAPATKHKRGPRMYEAITHSGQLVAFDAATYLRPEDTVAMERELWVLLIAHDQHEVRFELSRPKTMQRNQPIRSWLERIIFPAIDLTRPLPLNDDEAPGDGGTETIIDIPLDRR